MASLTPRGVASSSASTPSVEPCRTAARSPATTSGWSAASIGPRSASWVWICSTVRPDVVRSPRKVARVLSATRSPRASRRSAPLRPSRSASRPSIRVISAVSRAVISADVPLSRSCWGPISAGWAWVWVVAGCWPNAVGAGLAVSATVRLASRSTWSRSRALRVRASGS